MNLNISGTKTNIAVRYRGGGFNHTVEPAPRLKHALNLGPSYTPDNQSRASDPTQYALYNQNYSGKTYSVKYLGIVDGTMGILSRKMALTTSGQAALAVKPDDPSIPNVSP